MANSQLGAEICYNADAAGRQSRPRRSSRQELAAPVVASRAAVGAVAVDAGGVVALSSAQALPRVSVLAVGAVRESGSSNRVFGRQ